MIYTSKLFKNFRVSHISSITYITLNVTSISILFLVTFYFVYNNIIMGNPSNSKSFTTSLTLLSISFGITIIAIILRNLKSEKSQYDNEEIKLNLKHVPNIASYITEELMKKIDIKQNLESIFTSTEKTALSDAIVEKSILSLSGGVSKKILETARKSTSQSYEEKTLRRLAEHASVLGRRANFALVAGLLFAIGGVVVLSLIIISTPALAQSDTINITLQYLPKLSIMIIIELVAFFFLKTFARLLSDIRYIQNELTNVEMKLVGLHTSIAQKLEKITEKALLSLINTERNHILEKGQSSLENERDRVENKAFAEALSAAAEIIHGPSAPASVVTKT